MKIYQINAVEKMINTIEYVMNKYPKDDCRPRIEHCAMIDDVMLKRIKKSGIIPISNPGLVAFNAKDYNRYYGERVNMMSANKFYIDNGMLPTTMIFVQSKDGLSHCKKEYSTPQHCTSGATVMLNAVLKADND